MIFCTLFDSNYLDKGLALYLSMKKRIDSFRLYIVAFDDRCYEVLSDMRLKNVTLIYWRDIMDVTLWRIKDERTRAEFCWTCTPVIVEYILLKYNETVCTYIDADIYFFADPDKAIREIANHGCSVGVVPHRFERNYSNIAQMFNNGKYCIQFNTFINSEEGLLVLREWKEDCLNWCFGRYEDGKFGDQKYVDTWNMKYSCIYESQDLGVGVAPWNLHLYSFDGKKEGKIILRYKENSFPVVFYHFEGMKYLNDGRIFLHLWNYNVSGTRRKVKLIYGEYFRKLRLIRRHLERTYGITFDHMRTDKKLFLNGDYSLKKFCMDEGILNGLKEWAAFITNNVIKE